ncbi:AI-2E family transporter [Parvularcula dongshanensis]|uniref:Putative PurR-regulated permease PerM n=1 Tax=Parvularcula dongshanensis TaxID=1173995 RepID=A0A840I1T1_9PROT|nr:AI-2E family transporter [Parvularcula dongshanensis]MBB4658779.1 putative PurR-regulated permease PerM [Parvularcula dongshanensis]
MPDGYKVDTDFAEERAARRSTATWPMIGLFLIAMVGVFIYAKALLMPVMFAFLLALTFSPIRRVLERLHIPSGITALLIVVGLLAGLVGLVAGLSAPVSSYIANAPEILEQAESKLRDVSDTVSQVAEAGDSIELLSKEGTDSPQEVVVAEPGVVEKIAAIAPFILAQTVLTLVLLFFILASGDMFYEKIVHSIGRFRDKRRAVQIIYDIEAKLSRYFFTITVINAGLGVAIGLAMWSIGMPNPLLFGVAAFVFNFIPYLGALAGIALCTVIGLITFDTIGQAAFAGFLFFALTSLEGQFVTPYAVGRSLKLNTVVVFLAVAFWGWAWSVIGMIVAMPILIAVRAFSEHIPKLRGLGDFLSARHAELEPPRSEKPIEA